MTQEIRHSGLVVAGYSSDYEVLIEGTSYRCVLKGVQKKSGQSVLVGDCVVVDNLDPVNRMGRIIEIETRKNNLTKPKMANATTMMAMVSVASPAFDPLQLDRYITQGLLAGLKVVIVITKMDLCPSDLDIDKYQNYYQSIGLPVACLSILQPERMQLCLSLIQHETVVLAGLSGVGKSSFINKIRPDLNLKVGEVSQKIERGAHTTRHVSLIQISPDTFVADTPGFSQLKFDTISPVELKKAFPEFNNFECYYPDCDHVVYDDNIPVGLPEGCYLESHPDAISETRLTSYQTFLLEAKAFESHQRITSQKVDASFKSLDKSQGKKSDQLRLTSKQRSESRRSENQRIKIMSGRNAEEVADSEDDIDE